MPEINFLPTDQVPKGTSVKISQILKSTATVGFALLIVTAIGLGAFFVLTGKELEASQNKQEDLKTQAKSLEKTEQSLVLLKDRIAKIRGLMAGDTVSPLIEKTNTILATFPAGVAIKEIAIDKTAKISVSVLDTAELARFMSQAIAASKFKRIYLKAFSFSFAGGYLITLEFSDV